MLQLIQALHLTIEAAPQDAQLAKQIADLKLQVYQQLIENPQEQSLALEFNELEVYYTLKKKSIEEFELAVARLITLYNNGAESPQRFQYIGVYLLYLLSFNKFPQFYSQIELLPKEAFSNRLITFVLNLEQQLSIGSYGELESQHDPNALENVFLERIMDAIRLQVALSASAAYSQLRLSDALKIFKVDTVQQLQTFALKNQYPWRFDAQNVYFESKTKSSNPLNSDNLIQGSLHFVKELDEII